MNHSPLYDHKAKLLSLHLRKICCLILLGTLFLIGNLNASEVDSFLQKHCFDCHAGETKEGGLDLQALKKDLSTPELFAKWERLHDRVASGEMPPKTSDTTTPAERAAFLKLLANGLNTAHQASKGTVLRRLNRREYQNTLNDLFGTNAKLIDRLPEDSRAHEFENIGEALGISMVQMQRYLECITAVIDEATQRTIAKPESKVVTASYATTQGADQWLGKIWLKRDDGAVVFFKSFGYPSGMLREANVKKNGWYKVRVTGYAYQSEKPITFALGATTFARGVEQPTFGYFSLPPDTPTTVETTAWIPANYMIELNPYGITDRNTLKQVGLTEYKGPGLAVQKIEIEGPIVDEFPSRGHHLIFDGLNRKEILPRNPADRTKTFYTPKYEIASSDPAAEVMPVLQRVAAKAFRRPVTAAQLKPYLELFQTQLQNDTTFEESLRAAVSAIFCSPDFLYLRETPGFLDDYALASRLSYFLHRTSPDDELLALAAAGKLRREPDVLMAQVERLLAQEHSQRFVTDFTDAWLNLRDLEFTNPDSVLYPEYDQFLLWSMAAESRAFFQQLLDKNLSVSNVVKSDFAMLNSRLAEHYELPEVAGPELRPVKLPADSVRGGFLSQASVCKVSANGTNTSPVVRGVWVMERILGQAPAPPPPGIPGVEPDIRGASTLRELLDKHRKLDSCRGCHQAIDPPGFALESFDPIGNWRDNFRSIGNGKPVNKEVRGSKVRYKIGPSVDASGQLLNGAKFSGFAEFRELLLRDQHTLAKALATKFLTFATGREMGFSDRAEIERIVTATKGSNYGIRDLLKQVVASEIFRRK
jgi:hypothetical protein